MREKGEKEENEVRDAKGRGIVRYLPMATKNNPITKDPFR